MVGGPPSATDPTGMRPLVLALCVAFAVLFTAARAHAHAPRPRCIGPLASYPLLARDRATSFVRAVPAPAPPLRSQAPTLCSDPRQPGCHIDCPDAPSHHTSPDLHHEPVTLTTSVPEVDPAVREDVAAAAPPRGGPREGSTRSPWRPPSA